MDEWPSPRATKRLGHHQKNSVTSRSHLAAGGELIWDFRYVNKKLLNVEASLQSLKWLLPNGSSGSTFLQGTGLSGHLVFVQQRESALCRWAQTDTSACCAPAQNAACSAYRPSTCRKLQSGQEQPGSCYLLTPGASQTACKGVPYVVLPWWCCTFLPGRWGLWSPVRRTPPLAPGPGLQTWCLYR